MLMFFPCRVPFYHLFLFLATFFYLFLFSGQIFLPPSALFWDGFVVFCLYLHYELRIVGKPQSGPGNPTLCFCIFHQGMQRWSARSPLSLAFDDSTLNSKMSSQEQSLATSLNKNRRDLKPPFILCSWAKKGVPRSTPRCSMVLNIWATPLVWSSLPWRTDVTEPWWASQLHSSLLMSHQYHCDILWPWLSRLIRIACDSLEIFDDIWSEFQHCKVRSLCTTAELQRDRLEPERPKVQRIWPRLWRSSQNLSRRWVSICDNHLLWYRGVWSSTVTWLCSPVDTSWRGLNKLTVLLIFWSKSVQSALLGQMFCLGSDSMDYLQLAKFFKGRP